MSDRVKKADLTWLTDPRVFAVNRLKAHSDHRYYGTEEEMEAGEQSLCQSLNGLWAFHYSHCPERRPIKFYEEAYDDSGFGRIEVPGHMELQGYGQVHYINTMYPWDGHTELRPPEVDWENNPVGSYVRTFDLNQELRGKRVCISFTGVERAFYVWLNGQFVGYGEDSFTPSDFDLTPFIREKGNRLCVEVYKNSSASWIEDQDFFRFSGIFRDVYLYAKPEIHVEDLWAGAGLQEDYKTGTLRIRLSLSAILEAAEEAGTDGIFQKKSRPVLSLEEEKLSLHLALKDRDGKCVWESRVLHAELCEDPDGVMLALNEAPIEDVRLWSGEDPYLYQLIVAVMDQEGRPLEWIRQQVGFRRFEIRERVMLLNGKRLIINGVNRHEWNPERGRAITAEDMREDIRILKRNNINAVRTSHYPNQSLFYELCDENGIYVLDETNLESHGSWQKMGECEPSWNVPGSRPEWEDCVVDRAVSMTQRDKNHPSILWWSCGNESYAGTCIEAMSRYFHEKDPSRLVHYEGVYWNREFNHISDVESRMYASPEEVRDYLTRDGEKPYLLCEYMHSMGNSVGGMESYIKLLEEFPQYQGGFIWDFIDQAVYRDDADGKKVLGYGGDFGDRPTDYSFSGDGILFADRTEKPAMQEVRYWYSSKEERERFDAQKRRQEIAAEQALSGSPRNPYCPAKRPKGRSLEVIHGDVTLGVKGEDFSVLFSYTEYGPVSLVYQGREWIYRAPRPAFWRAATENDKGNGFPVKSAVWQAADQWIACSSFEVKEELPESVTIIYQYETCTAPSTQVIVSYTVYCDGTIGVKESFKGNKDLPQLPLFGMRFILPMKAGKLRWLGLSGETYPDRKKGALFGIHVSGADIPAYLVPQECGCRADTRWAQVWRMAGRNMDGETGSCGLEFMMEDGPFHFTAIPYTPQELESAYHKEDLPIPRRTVVTIAAEMRGVGGIDSWGSDVEDLYQISAAEDIAFSFLIRPAKS